MPSQKTSGTQVAVITTEHTLATITDAGIYVLAIDANAHVNGDATEIRIKVKVLSGGTTREYLSYHLADVLAQKVVMSIPIPVLHEMVCTLKQVSGTGRSFPWQIIQLDA